MKITKIICLLYLGLISLNLQATEIIQGKFRIQILPTESWVKAITPTNKSNTTQSTQGIKYLLKSVQLNFVNPEREIYNHLRMEVTSAVGLKEASKINIQYNPAFEKLRLNSINVARNQKVINKLLRKNIKLIQREEEIESGIFSGTVTAFILLDDVRV